jgi:hypothetical protein
MQKPVQKHQHPRRSNQSIAAEAGTEILRILTSSSVEVSDFADARDMFAGVLDINLSTDRSMCDVLSVLNEALQLFSIHRRLTIQLENATQQLREDAMINPGPLSSMVAMPSSALLVVAIDLLRSAIRTSAPDRPQQVLRAWVELPEDEDVQTGPILCVYGGDDQPTDLPFGLAAAQVPRIAQLLCHQFGGSIGGIRLSSGTTLMCQLPAVQPVPETPSQSLKRSPSRIQFVGDDHLFQVVKSFVQRDVAEVQHVEVDQIKSECCECLIIDADVRLDDASLRRIGRFERLVVLAAGHDQIGPGSLAGESVCLRKPFSRQLLRRSIDLGVPPPLN